jgi:hypothetical protein
MSAICSAARSPICGIATSERLVLFVCCLFVVRLVFVCFCLVFGQAASFQNYGYLLDLAG